MQKFTNPRSNPSFHSQIDRFWIAFGRSSDALGGAKNVQNIFAIIDVTFSYRPSRLPPRCGCRRGAAAAAAAAAAARSPVRTSELAIFVHWTVGPIFMNNLERELNSQPHVFPTMASHQNCIHNFSVRRSLRWFRGDK